MRQINQRGIAIGPILYIVAILAVLVSAIAAGSGAFNGDISAVSAKVQATTILEQANEVKFAVDRLIAKGCTDTEISFENPVVGDYINPNSPSDKSCHVFDVNGGGIIYKKPIIGDLCFSGFLTFYGIGKTCQSDSSCPDLSFTLKGIEDKVCAEINYIIHGNPTIPEHEAWAFIPVPINYFKGSYFGGWTADYTLHYPSLSFISGKEMGCFRMSWTPDQNMMFRILIAR